MNLRRPILLSAASVLFMISSCDHPKNTTALSTANRSAEQKRADSIISGIKGKVTTININPAKQNRITSKQGIKFSIPPNAFVTSTGMKPKGPVCIQISEYHNPADILVSKIPMQYKTKEGSVQMESAGMFSLTAKAQDETLQLAEGKDIDVEVPSKNSDINFNLYYFDPMKNAWVKTIDSLPTDQTQSEEAKQNSAPATATMANAGINVEWSAVEANKRVIDGKTISLVKPDCSYTDSDFNFTVATDNFPELSLYKDLVWIGYTSYDEIRVEAGFASDRLIRASILERETPLNKYLISFEFRNIKFDAYMKIASKSDMCEINEEMYFSYYDNRPVDEKKIEKINTNIKKVKKQDNIFRSFAINKLGLWNCDRLYVLPQKMNVTPKFRSITTGEHYESTTTYMIDKKINSVWTFQNTITLNPDSDNLVLFVNQKGQLCYARLNNLSKTHKEKELNLIIDVEEMVDKPDSTEDLDALLKNI